MTLPPPRPRLPRTATVPDQAEWLPCLERALNHALTSLVGAPFDGYVPVDDPQAVKQPVVVLGGPTGRAAVRCTCAAGYLGRPCPHRAAVALRFYADDLARVHGSREPADLSRIPLGVLLNRVYHGYLAPSPAPRRRVGPGSTPDALPQRPADAGPSCFPAA